MNSVKRLDNGGIIDVILEVCSLVRVESCYFTSSPIMYLKTDDYFLKLYVLV